MDRNYLLSSEKSYKAVLKLGAPSFISTISTILYNTINMIFIGRYTFTIGLVSVSLYVPIQMIISAIVLLFSMGIGTNISILLGKKEISSAKDNVGSLLTFTILISIIMFFIGMTFSKEIVSLLGASPSISGNVNIYAKTMFLGILFYPLTLSLNSILRAEGSSKLAMNGAIISIISNFILDFLFIVFFHLGIFGAGLSTSLAKLINLLYILYVFRNKTFLKINIKDFNFNFNIIKKSIPIGLSSFLSQTIGAVSMMLFNHLLLIFGGDTALAVYGIISKITTSIQEAITGFTRGSQPLLGYNFGCKNIKRIKETLKYTIIYSVIFGTIGSLLVFIFSKDLIELFSTNPTIIGYGSDILRLTIISSPLIGIYYLSMTFFRSIKKPKEAIILSISRRLLFFTPFLYILPYALHLGVLGLWVILPLSNILSILLAIIFFYKKIGLLKN